jgi:hypothetical protein
MMMLLVLLHLLLLAGVGYLCVHVRRFAALARLVTAMEHRTAVQRLAAHLQQRRGPGKDALQARIAARTSASD